jgi:hypothetical protein
MSVLANYFAFQLGWLACVLGGANHWPWAGTAVAGLLISVHLWRAPHPRPELILILLTGTVGAVLDSLLVATGLLKFPSGTLLPGTAPHWIIAMWMLFATTLNVSLRWLQGRWLLAGALGSVAGPLAYYAGSKLDGVSFSAQSSISLMALACAWCFAMAVLSLLAKRFDGMAETNRQSGLPDESATI